MSPQASTLYPFVPSGPDFATALAFFSELGFVPLWQQSEYAGLKFGGAYFVLQHINVPEWQKNQMIVLEVNDLDTYWSELAAKDLATKFPGVGTRPPTDFPWGREVHIVDPAGVCWHVRQKNGGS